MLPSTHPKEQGHVQGVDEARPAETPRSWASQPVTASNTNELKKMQTSLPLNLASLGPLAQQAQDAQNTSLGGRGGKHQLLGEVWSRPLPKSFFSIWADLDILQIFLFLQTVIKESVSKAWYTGLSTQYELCPVHATGEWKPGFGTMPEGFTSNQKTNISSS